MALRFMSLSAPMMAGARAYAAQVQVPLRLFGIDGRYATALYTAAVKSSALDKVEADMKTVAATVAKDEQLRQFFASPVLSRAQKLEGVAALSKKLKLQSAVTNFLETLADNGRLNEFEKITASFAQLMSAHRGEVVGSVTTAAPLDAKIKAQLEAALKKNFIEPNQTLSLSAKVDPSIMGGMIVQVGDRTVDLSVASKIKRINAALAESI